MIGFLRGVILESDAPNLIIEVNGVGYEVQMALSSFAQLPPVGQELALYIHVTKREDGEFWYGFLTKEQRALFRALIKISNIGPKIALAILSAMEPGIFAQYVTNNDAAALEHIPGIGAKTAKRLIIEMRDKIAEWEQSAIEATAPTTAMQDAIGALVALGYKPHEARQALYTLQDKNLPSGELIKLALKKMH